MNVLPVDIIDSPIFAMVDFEKAKKYSPWPERILGIDTWKKIKRDTEEIIKEYNDGWYKEALNYFDANKDSIKKFGLGSPAVFLKNFEDSMSGAIKKKEDVYGQTEKSKYLISLGEIMYLGDLGVVNSLFRSYVTEVIKDYVQLSGVETVVEAGSGTGTNLFNLVQNLGLAFVKGGEICPNGVEFANNVAQLYDVKAEFINFDYYNSQDIVKLCDCKEDYLLITVHSIEQLPTLPENFIESITNLPHPPKAVLHFEPIQFPLDNKSDFDSYCHKYSQINLYNQDLYSKLNEAFLSGKIEILDIKKHIMGISAFNSTSFIAWKPI